MTILGNQWWATIRPKFRKGSHCIPQPGGKEIVMIRGVPVLVIIWWSMTSGDDDADDGDDDIGGSKRIAGR